jgi:hypothetical protein
LYFVASGVTNDFTKSGSDTSAVERKAFAAVVGPGVGAWSTSITSFSLKRIRFLAVVVAVVAVVVVIVKVVVVDIIVVVLLLAVVVGERSEPCAVLLVK